MTPAQANQEVQSSIETKLNEAIRQTAAKGQKSFVFDFGPWAQNTQNEAKKALEDAGYKVEKTKKQYAAPDACDISWT